MSYVAEDFVKILIKSKVIRFGKFILKSGMISNVFFDFGQICYGSDLKKVGEHYADFIVDNSLNNFDVLFGPAYKGINIATATSTALYDKYKLSIPYSYNRKISKTHAEGGKFIGYDLSKTKSVLIVDDVFTDGGTKYETIELLSQFKNLSIKGVIIGIDRQEVDENGESFISIFKKKTGIEVYALTTKEEVLSYDK